MAVLEVKFRSGAVYRYFAVPARIFEELPQAEYFNRYIRNRFVFAKIQPAKPAVV